MAETSFPGDLLDAQMRLHQATAELAALLRSLPWFGRTPGGVARHQAPAHG
ncbi:hypothetical protein [Streptomyces sp. NPDC059928]|uniref:hypothetical protein n=1 Tax=unclassified Streptomyces TaxID=2593676 RepID=UPI00364C22FB